MEEVQQHKTEDDAWMVLHGKVGAAASASRRRICVDW
jgi:hypothetical protein